jgi:hypothetical protein
MSQRRPVLVVLTLVTALTLSVATPGAAIPPARVDVPFDEPIILSDVCPFAVEIAPLTSGERLTTFFDRQGTPVMQLTTGPLKVRITNPDTEESIDLNISGPGRLVINEEQGTFTQQGPWLTVVFPGAFADDPDFAGLFLTKGPVVSECEFDPTTSACTFLRYTAITKNVTDLCAALAD